jgi:hypothetical protein
MAKEEDSEALLQQLYISRCRPRVELYMSACHPDPEFWMCRSGSFFTSMQVSRMLVCQYSCMAVKEL